MSEPQTEIERLIEDSRRLIQCTKVRLVRMAEECEAYTEEGLNKIPRWRFIRRNNYQLELRHKERVHKLLDDLNDTTRIMFQIKS